MEILKSYEEENVDRVGNFVARLEPRYDSAKSFYGKANIFSYKKATYLQSYETVVAKVYDNKLYVYGFYSHTTARHIREFAKQNGFENFVISERTTGNGLVIDNTRAMDLKKQIEQKSEEIRKIDAEISRVQFPYFQISNNENATSEEIMKAKEEMEINVEPLYAKQKEMESEYKSLEKEYEKIIWGLLIWKKNI